MSMAGQAAIRRFLAERGAGRTPHSGRTLLDHLAGTARILEPAHLADAARAWVDAALAQYEDPATRPLD